MESECQIEHFELKQEIKIEPNNESDPQVKMEPDIDPLEINPNFFMSSINGSQSENENKKSERKKNRLKKIQIDSVHGDLRYNCEHLKTHIDSVHGNVRYACDQSDYKTTWKGNLKRHTDSIHEDV